MDCTKRVDTQVAERTVVGAMGAVAAVVAVVVVEQLLLQD